MATHRVSKGLASAASLHWFTRYVFFFRETPARSTSDRAALRFLVEADAHGDRDIALSVIEKVIAAPISGRSFAARYRNYLAWIEARCPSRFRPTDNDLRGIRRILRGAA